MRRVVLAICGALLPWATEAAPQPSATIPGFAVMLAFQTRPERVGDHYSYVADIQSHTTRDGAVRDVDLRESFTLDIVSIDKAGMVVRYTQTDAEQQPDGGDQASALLLKAWNGVPVDFQTTSNGYPGRLVDEAAVKGRLEANFAGLSPKAVAMGPSLDHWLDGLSDAAFMNMVGERLTTIAAMQWRGLVKAGRQELPSETHQDADGGQVTVKKTVELSVAPGPPCRILAKRSTWTERPGAANAVSSSLETEATVAESDGWVIALTETQKNVTPSAQQVRTIKISRTDAGCPS